MEKEVYDDLIAALVNLDNAIRNFIKSLIPTENVVYEQTYVTPQTVSMVQQLQQIVPPVLSIIQKPFDGHKFFVSYKKITSTGNKIDLDREADFVMVMPSIDAQIDFDNEVSDQTPVVPGGTVFSHPHKTSKIYFKGTSKTSEGTLSVWAYWWK